MYILYHDKKSGKIEVKKPKKILENLNYTEEVTHYNDWHFICLNREPLVEKAREMQQTWIVELESALNKLKQIKL